MSKKFISLIILLIFNFNFLSFALAPISFYQRKNTWNSDNLANAIQILFKVKNSSHQYIVSSFENFTEFWRDGWYSHHRYPVATSGKFILFDTVDNHLNTIRILLEKGLLLRSKIVFESGNKTNGGLLIYSPSHDFKLQGKNYQNLIESALGQKLGWRPDIATRQNRVFRFLVFKPVVQSTSVTNLRELYSIKNLREIIANRDDAPVFLEYNKKILLRLLSEESSSTPEDKINDVVIEELMNFVGAESKEELIDRLRAFLFKELSVEIDKNGKTNSSA